MNGSDVDLPLRLGVPVTERLPAGVPVTERLPAGVPLAERLPAGNLPRLYVRQSSQIGRVGMTGYATGPHLHVDTQKKKGKGKKTEHVYVNPMNYLKQPK